MGNTKLIDARALLGLIVVVGLWGCGGGGGGSSDGGDEDGAARDAGAADSGGDTGAADAGAADAGAADAGTPDSGGDAGAADAGTPDSGGDAGASECEGAPADWIWCDDFEATTALSARYPDTGATGMDRSTDAAYRGSASLRQHYEAGQVDAGWVSFWYADALGGDRGPRHDELYVRYFHRFEPGFEGLPPKMSRIRSLGPGYTRRFSVHQWIDSGWLVADTSAPDSTQANSSGWLALARSSFSFAEPSNIGRWVCIEFFVRINTPGMADGAIRYWADDELVLERTGVDIRGGTNENFNEIMLDGYWNGGSPRAQNRYFDNFVVSTSRIGCTVP